MQNCYPPSLHSVSIRGRCYGKFQRADARMRRLRRREEGGGGGASAGVRAMTERLEGGGRQLSGLIR